MPKIADSHLGEDRSFERLAASVRPAFVVRREIEHDCGCDGTLEVRVPSTSEATNLRAQFQLKHTTVPKYLKSGSLSYSDFRADTIDYLAGGLLPGLLFVHDQANDELFVKWVKKATLEIASSNPRWLDSRHSRVTVHFSRKLDNSFLDELAQELRTHRNQLNTLAPGPGFVRSPSPENLPAVLRRVSVHSTFKSEKNVERIVARIKPATLVPVLGPPGSGKLSLLSAMFHKESTYDILSTRFGEVGLIVVDLQDYVGSRRLLRGLSIALAAPGKTYFEDPEVGFSITEERAEAVLLGELILQRFQGLTPIAVFANLDAIVDDSQELQDLSRLLSTPSFSQGACVATAARGPVPEFTGKWRVSTPVDISTPMSVEECKVYMRSLGVNEEILSDISQDLQSAAEYRLPGVVMDAVNRFENRRNLGLFLEESQEEFRKALLEASEGYVSAYAREILGELRTSSSEARISSILAMAAMPDMPLKGKYLPKSKLAELGWARGLEGAIQLTDLGVLALRSELRMILAGKRHESEQVITRSAVREVAMGLLREADAETWPKVRHALERGAAWLHAAVPEDQSLSHFIISAFLPLVLNDLFFPWSKEEAVALLDSHLTSTDGDVITAIASLIISMNIERDRDSFVKRLDSAVVLVTETRTYCWAILRALDRAAAVVSKRYGDPRSEFHLREKLIDIFSREPPEWAHASSGAKRQYASWLLSSSNLASKLEEPEVSLRRLTEAEELIIGQNPSVEGSWERVEISWMRSRLKEARARHQENQDERIELLGDAWIEARRALVASRGALGWMRFFLKTTRLLVAEARTDAQREKYLGDTMETLSFIYGETRNWPEGVVASSATLLRQSSALLLDGDKEIRVARQAVDLASHRLDSARDIASVGDTRFVLMSARCYYSLGKALLRQERHSEGIECWEVARSLVGHAHRVDETLDSWRLSLFLHDSHSAMLSSMEKNPESQDCYAVPISSSLRAAMAECRRWLKDNGAGLPMAGEVKLWLVQREWRQKGSLLREATDKSRSPKAWYGLPVALKVRRLTAMHESRLQALEAIERAFGGFEELVIQKLMMEAQYSRSVALLTSHRVDHARYEHQYVEATRQFPASERIKYARARYAKYVWDRDEAIVLLRDLIAASADSRRRRDAIVMLIETLLDGAIQSTMLSSRDRRLPQRELLLEEALKWVEEIKGFVGTARTAAILRDRVFLEAGKKVEWQAIDEAFDTVIGSGYLDTVTANISKLRLRTGEASAPTSVADAVIQDFTSREALRGVGGLYLRRGQLQRSDDQIRDFEHAFRAFDATRIIDARWANQTLPTISFLQGLAIFEACLASRSINPFKAKLFGKASLLELGAAQLQSASSRTVGAFHDLAREYASRAAKLESRLLSNW